MVTRARETESSRDLANRFSGQRSSSLRWRIQRQPLIWSYTRWVSHNQIVPWIREMRFDRFSRGKRLPRKNPERFWHLAVAIARIVRRPSSTVRRPPSVVRVERLPLPAPGGSRDRHRRDHAEDGRPRREPDDPSLTTSLSTCSSNVSACRKSGCASSSAFSVWRASRFSPRRYMPTAFR